jgi:hypothetical protein
MSLLEPAAVAKWTPIPGMLTYSFCLSLEILNLIIAMFDFS